MTERNQNEQEQQNTQQQETTTEQEQTQQEQRETQARKFVGRPEDLVMSQPTSEVVEETMEQDDNAEETTEAPKMTDAERGKANGVSPNTIRAARNSIAKQQISGESFEKVLDGEMTIAEARAAGRDEPKTAGPAVRANKKDRSRKCMCGVCGLTTKGGRFIPGHDQRVKGMIAKAVRGGTFDQLSEEIQGYAAERGLVEATQERMAAEEIKRQEKAKAKTEAQRVKEGAAEAKKRAKTISDIREVQPTDEALDALNSEEDADQE